MSTELQATRRDATLILTLCNPGAKNVLHPDLCAAAIEVLSTAERDDAVRAVVITGAGGYFCAGSTLHQLLEYRTKDSTEGADLLDSLHGWIEAIHDCPKPVIAAVEGGAEGAGFSLALACDLFVAGTSASFAMPNVRTKLSPEGGAAWLLSQAMPRQSAAEILLGGNLISATKLHALGVINRLVPDGTGLEAALEWADEMATLSPYAIAQAKSLLTAVPQQSLDRHFAAEKQAFIESLLRHGN